MCLGLPMRIVEADGLRALVSGRGGRREVSLLLVGEQPLGTAVLVHAGEAVRVLGEEEVGLIEQALDEVFATVAPEPAPGGLLAPLESGRFT